MRFCMCGDFLKDLIPRSVRSPIPLLLRTPAIQDQPRKIKTTPPTSALDLVSAETFCAPFAQLPERHRTRQSSANVYHAIAACAGDLFQNQWGQIARMEAITYLVPDPSKPMYCRGFRAR